MEQSSCFTYEFFVDNVINLIVQPLELQRKQCNRNLQIHNRVIKFHFFAYGFVNNN